MSTTIDWSEYQQPRHNSLVMLGRWLFLGLLAYWTVKLVFADPRWIFLDNVNFLFHEAGHLIFSFGGRFLTILGGTLMQLLVPVLVGVAFWREFHWYGMGFSAWWFGQNMVNVSVYMSDAQERVLPLFGNGEHDWHALLSMMRLLPYDNLLGGMVFVLGMGVMVVALSLLTRRMLQAGTYQ